jgi:hypothetical protein
MQFPLATTQVALNSWTSSTTQAAGATAYEVSTINSVTYQVITTSTANTATHTTSHQPPPRMTDIPL